MPVELVDDGSEPPRLQRFAAGLALALAAFALIGWTIGQPLLASYVAARPTLAPMTAVGLVAASIGSLLLPTRRRISLGLYLGVALAGAIVVGSHAVDLLSALGLPKSVWPSPITAAMFVACGIGGMHLARGRYVPGQAISLALLLFAGLLALATVFPRTELYALLPGTGVSIPTSIAFIGLSLSQLLVFRRAGIAGALSSGGFAGPAGLRVLLATGASVLLLTLACVVAVRYALLDADSAIVLAGWGALVVSGTLIWRLVLAVDRLAQSRAQAERERDRVRTLVVGALTHDIRSPLQAAMAAGAILQRKVDDPHAASVAERMQLSHRRLDRLLRSLLDNLALDAGRPLGLKPEPFAMEALVAQVISDNATAVGNRVSQEGAATGWWDRDAVYRVVENLLLNAVKYGRPDAAIACRIQSSAGDVLVSVANEGSPIDATQWESIFHPFARGSDVAKALPGWGIGLAFGRSVASMHGGSLRVASSDERTTVFELRLPLDSRTQAAP